MTTEKLLAEISNKQTTVISLLGGIYMMLVTDSNTLDDDTKNDMIDRIGRILGNSGCLAPEDDSSAK